MSTIPFRPRGHWVVVDRDPDQGTIGKFVLPDQSKVKMNRGRVLAVGPGILNEAGVMIPAAGIAVNDIVQWSQAGGHEIEVRGVVYTFVPAANIILVETA